MTSKGRTRGRIYFSETKFPDLTSHRGRGERTENASEFILSRTDFIPPAVDRKEFSRFAEKERIKRNSDGLGRVRRKGKRWKRDRIEDQSAKEARGKEGKFCLKRERKKKNRDKNGEKVYVEKVTVKGARYDCQGSGVSGKRDKEGRGAQERLFQLEAKERPVVEGKGGSWGVDRGGREVLSRNRKGCPCYPRGWGEKKEAQKGSSYKTSLEMEKREKGQLGRFKKIRKGTVAT